MSSSSFDDLALTPDHLSLFCRRGGFNRSVPHMRMRFSESFSDRPQTGPWTRSSSGLLHGSRNSPILSHICQMSCVSSYVRVIMIFYPWTISIQSVHMEGLLLRCSNGRRAFSTLQLLNDRVVCMSGWISTEPVSSGMMNPVQTLFTAQITV